MKLILANIKIQKNIGGINMTVIMDRTDGFVSGEGYI